MSEAATAAPDAAAPVPAAAAPTAAAAPAAPASPRAGAVTRGLARAAAAPRAPPAPAVDVAALLRAYRDELAALGSRLPLGFLAAAVAAALGLPWTAAAAARAVRDAASAGLRAPAAQHGSRDEDANDASLWRWEVRDVDATFDRAAAAAVRACRASRMAEGKLYRQLKKVADAEPRDGAGASRGGRARGPAAGRRTRPRASPRSRRAAPRRRRRHAAALARRQRRTLFERILEARGDAPPRGAPSPYAGGAPYAGAGAALRARRWLLRWPPPPGWRRWPPPPPRRSLFERITGPDGRQPPPPPWAGQPPPCWQGQPPPHWQGPAASHWQGPPPSTGRANRRAAAAGPGVERREARAAREVACDEKTRALCAEFTKADRQLPRPEMARGGLGLFLCCSSDGGLPRKVRHGPASPSGAEESAARERSVSAHANAVEDDDDVHAGAPSYVGERRAATAPRTPGAWTTHRRVVRGRVGARRAHGAGRYVFGSGSVYEGEHRRGKANGVHHDLRAGRRGSASGATTVRRAGDRVIQRRFNVHGRATFTKANGQVWGTMTFASGHAYDGDWVDDKRHGAGTYTYASGDKYTGELRTTSSLGRAA
ncbi:hypothetical protein JL722_2152 [Aureococcus anophagefferens]|nr:hypothetical protein JL722_2152 [Aureococcus anophagefferens]